jgi:hypothetical protein
MEGFIQQLSASDCRRGKGNTLGDKQRLLFTASTPFGLSSMQGNDEHEVHKLQQL